MSVRRAQAKVAGLRFEKLHLIPGTPCDMPAYMCSAQVVTNLYHGMEVTSWYRDCCSLNETLSGFCEEVHEDWGEEYRIDQSL